MKKTVYVAPQMEVCLLNGQELLQAVSSPTGTNIDGLGVSDESYEGEGRVKYSSTTVNWQDWGE